MRLLKRENRPQMLAKIVNQMLIKHHEELVKCLPIEQRQKALDDLRVDPFYKEPPSPERAKAFIEGGFIKPARERKEWEQIKTAIAKKYPRGKVVEYDEAENFIEGLSCAGGFHFFYSPIEPEKLLRPSIRFSWGELAELVGAPVYVVPAMDRRDKHQAVVNAKMVRDGDRISRHPKLKHRGHQPRIQGGGGS